ncbi:MAG: hypothetical protein JSW26_04475 [Desulfobacterales bacterium]|nr:MAG: hypothetical protein JSW26_04475 [Desulfobacterales bacterium]
MDDILKRIKKIEFEQINYQKLSDDYFNLVEGRIPQFEINAEYRIIERKPDSSHADKNYKAEGKKVIELINTLESMLKNIQKRNYSLASQLRFF